MLNWLLTLKPGKEGNLANLFCLGGYLMMLFMEKVAFSEAHATIHAVLDHSNSHNHHHHGNQEGEEHSEPVLTSTPTVEAMQQVPREGLLPPGIEAEPSIASEPSMPYSLYAQSTETEEAVSIPRESSLAMGVKASLSPRSALILLTAMSFHSFFEAMALGIASDTKASLLMATSIGLHQPAESMALLIAFLKTNMPNNAIIRWLGLFSLVAPIGLATGIFVSSVASPWVEASIIAITAGTFLYVGATEVVNEEFEETKGSEKYLKFASLLGGMVSILAISKISEGIGEGHSHHHHHHLSAKDAAYNSWSFFGTSSNPSSQNAST